MADSENEAVQPLFRAAKRRKIWRKRTSDNEEHDDRSDPAQVPTPGAVSCAETRSAQNAGQLQSHSDDLDVAQTSIPALLRRQKLAKARRGGIGFAKNVNTTLQEERSSEPPKDSSLSIIDHAQSRFVPQMGLMTKETIENRERHMESYVDSKMAKISGGVKSSECVQAQAMSDLPKRGPSPVNGPSQKPATESEALQEVDLGPEAILQNIARTEAARRRLEAGTSIGSDLEASRKVRLGRDGKPRKNRNRRNSADAKRDQMVEQLMQDARMGLFQEPEASEKPDDGKATDDRVAEQFWQDYMEQVNYRNMRKAPSNVPAPAGKAAKIEHGQRGPKLGGSRSARAAMKAQEEKAVKK
ncbi:MAG: hypothetical protein M1821_002147 [Bathelium mastoideum]|nr:MAG: hypothetical protein M1821_002147 [Bathelium mastoideum]KAI9685023.1 MAG: hypothetical protein M1822_005415 [Bathelium mastoideum]